MSKPNCVGVFTTFPTFTIHYLHCSRRDLRVYLWLIAKLSRMIIIGLLLPICWCFCAKIKVTDSPHEIGYDVHSCTSLWNLCFECWDSYCIYIILISFWGCQVMYSQIGFVVNILNSWVDGSTYKEIMLPYQHIWIAFYKLDSPIIQPPSRVNWTSNEANSRTIKDDRNRFVITHMLMFLCKN